MIKKIINIFIIICILVNVLYIPVFALDEPNKMMNISDKEINIIVSESYPLSIKNCEKTVNWKSYDTSIATVNANGVVKGIKTGATRIQAKVGNYIFTCVVKVSTSSLKVHFIDIGIGDSILIECDGKVTLIDTGMPVAEDIVLDYLDSLKIKKIDNFIITHAHEDHYGNVLKILDTYEIKKVYITSNFRQVSKAKKIVNKLSEMKDIELIRAKAGVEVNVGRNAKAEILSPTTELTVVDESNSSVNGNSIVLRMEYKKKVFLFMGDAFVKQEKIMIKLGYDLKADVLKVGHHGNKSSTCESFLEKVNPKIAVIFDSKDLPSSSNPKVLARLKKYTDKIYQTQKRGNITIQYSKGKLLVNYDKK